MQGRALLSDAAHTSGMLPACRAGYDPRQAVRRRFGLVWPWTAWTGPLHRTLQRLATSGPPTALTAIDASDRGGDPKCAYVWPNAAKQAHNLATHLPAAMAEFGSRTALKQHRVQKGKQLQPQQKEVQKQEPQQQETAQQGEPPAPPALLKRVMGRVKHIKTLK